MANYFMAFKNIPSMALYLMELQGQISDGKYENLRPAEHWKWITADFTYRLVEDGENPCGNYPYRRFNNYNLREWPGYITRANKKHVSDEDLRYAWAERVLFYGGFASILNPSDVEVFIKEAYNLETIVESLGWYLKRNGNENFSYDKFLDDLNVTAEWRVKYTQECTLFSKENVEKYAASFGTYTIKTLKEDLKYLKETLHNEVY